MNHENIMIIFKLLGALGLLIYGMKMMSDALQRMAGDHLRRFLGRMMKNRVTGMLTGALVTCAVQSSSATTVMTVSFVSAGLLSLAQAISVIMGANIGTTLTSWIMSLGYNIDLSNVVFPAFLLGIVLIYKKRYRFVGDLLFGVAFMLLSLVVLSATGKEMDLQHISAVVSFFSSFDTANYLTIILFLAIGTIITCVVQSSAAVMAITILLCSTGVMPIHLGIALVMGENIGTTATANIAALGTNTQARRAALAHLLFNVFGVMWVLCVFYPFVDMVCRVVGYTPGSQDQASLLPIVLATFHTCFNVTNTFILIWFIPQFERVVCRLLPEREQAMKEDFKLKYIQANLIQTPEIAVLQAMKETAQFAANVQNMFALIRELLEEGNDEKFDKLFERITLCEDNVDRTEYEIARFLEQVSENHLSDITKMKVRRMIREISELESIGDACYNMSRTLNRCHEEGRYFPSALEKKLLTIMATADDALTRMNVVMNLTDEEVDIRETYRIENEIDRLDKQFKEENIRAVNDRQYDYSIGMLFADCVNECEKLGDYVVNVVQARLGHQS